MITDTRVFTTTELPGHAPAQLMSKQSYRSKEYPFIPQRVEAKWTRNYSEPWQFRTLTVFGPRVKKDGTASMITTDSHYIEWGEPVQEIPAWLADLVALAAPKDEQW